jgi:hypothetical protein
MACFRMKSRVGIQPLLSRCTPCICVCAMHALGCSCQLLTVYRTCTLLPHSRLQDAADTAIPAAARRASLTLKAVKAEASQNKNKKQAHAALAAQTRHQRDALQWLCSKAGPAAVAAPSLAEQLLRVPQPHVRVVRTLLKKGVRVTLKQLVSCANAHAHTASSQQCCTLLVPGVIL